MFEVVKGITRSRT